jgi:hypothetical protein
MPHEEYLRRNLVHAGSVGVRAGIGNAVDRLNATKRPPKWLVAQLQGLIERAEHASADLAQWRNSAPDAPGRDVQ